LGVGDTYTTVEGTGGAVSQSYTPAGSVDGHTLTTAEMPSHNHTFTGSSVNTGN
jgi:microcystin-dependent protein